MESKPMGPPEGQPRTGRETFVSKARKFPGDVVRSVGKRLSTINPLSSSPELVAEAVGNVDVRIEDPKTANTLLEATFRGTAPARGASGTRSGTRTTSEPSREPRERGLSRRAQLVIAAAAATVTIAGAGMGINQLIRSNDNSPPVSGDVGSFEPIFDSDNWIQLTPNEIKQYAKVPEVKPIDEGVTLPNVSPVLQDKAEELGYTITFQGDRDDVTGRTFLTKGRQTPTENGFKHNNLSTFEDQGFGDNGMTVTGVFEGWSLKPGDRNEIYAELSNPITEEKYVVNINLRATETERGLPTRFIVDNLNYGPDEVLKMRINGGEWFPTFFLPDKPTDMEGPSAGTKYKNFTDFPTFHDLLAQDGTILNGSVKQGDIVTAFYPVGVGSKSQAKPTDENGAYFGGLFVVRNFEGATARTSQAAEK